MDWQTHLPALIVAFPFLGAVVTPLVSLAGRGARHLWFLLCSCGTTVLALLLWRRVALKGAILYVVGGESWDLALPAGLSLPPRIVLAVDALGALIVVVGALLAFAGTLAYLPSDRGTPEEERSFVVLYLLAMSSALAMVVTSDLFNFALSFGLFSLASTSIVAFGKKKGAAVVAAFDSLLFSGVLLSLILFAVALLYGRYNTVNMAALARLLRFGFVEKTVLVLFAATLLTRYGALPFSSLFTEFLGEASPSAGCILISGTLVGFYALVRIVFSLYGTILGEGALGWVFVVSGLLSISFGLAFGFRSRKFPLLPGFIFLAQTGHVLLGLGVALRSSCHVRAMADYGMVALKGALSLAVVSSLACTLLFLATAFIRRWTSSENLVDVGGLAKVLPKTTVSFFLAAWVVAGLPPFIGYTPKLLLHQSLFAFNPLLGAVSIAASIGAAVLLTRFFHGLFLGPLRVENLSQKEASLPAILAMGGLLCLLLFLSFLPSWSLTRWIEPSVTVLLDQAGYVKIVLGGGL